MGMMGRDKSKKDTYMLSLIHIFLMAIVSRPTKE